ncbi:MAG TPA: N-acyl homoserine lactonase family protein [Burkholderiaceae bacterium]|nr:N-acyl homoserine lactonase family protein [Burkholderiaceae bacterium]
MTTGVAVHALSGGRLKARRSFFFVDAAPQETVSVPVACWLVVHPRGRLVFDTGLHPDSAADPVGRLGERRAGRFAIDSPPGDDAVASLARLGLAAGDVTHVVNSHLHFDHCGCNRCFGRARVLVQRAELESVRAALEAGADDPADWNDPARPPETVDGEHDVFGDGSVVALPTPGHTPGHQSLRVTTGSGRVLVLVGDAAYTARHVDEDMLPPAAAVWHAPTMADSLARLRAMRDRGGAELIYSHDEAQWRDLAARGGRID